MPSTTIEAANELLAMLKERDLTRAWLARRLGRNEMWVSRKVRGQVPLTIDDYSRMKQAIEEVPLPAATQK